MKPISPILEALFAKDATADSAAILCRAVPAPLTADGMIMYMPGGAHRINPSQNGKAVEVQVLADRAGAVALEAQRQAIVAKGGRPFFDFAHKDEEASFWPERFVWAELPEPGIYCQGEWSSAGKQAIDGKLWRQFSPVFFVDDVKAKPARIICNDKAGPNMGGLVNRAAFKAILPLWAEEARPAAQARGLVIGALKREAQKLLAEVRNLTRR